MSMSSSGISILRSIEREVRRVHPDRKYENLMVDLLDAHLSPSRLSSLLQRLNSSPLVIAELELANQEADRSHTFHIGERSRPSWEHFNRTLSDSARVDELKQNDSLLFLNVQLSRVGPFWTSSWNNFVLENGKPVPKDCSGPPGFDWQVIRNHTEEILVSYGLESVVPEILNKPIPWLSSSVDHVLESRGRFPGPTVYHALFGELY